MASQPSSFANEKDLGTKYNRMDKFYVYMYLRSNKSKHGKAGTPYYVGKGKGMRAYRKQHRVRPPTDRSMISFVARNLSEEDAHALEISLIARYGRISNGTGCLRNLTEGGEGTCGMRHSEEWKKEQSKRFKETRQKEGFIHSSGMKGKHHSQESKMKISDSQRGRVRCEETRRKMGLAAKGRINFWKGKKRPPLSLENVEKIRLRMTGRKRGPNSEQWNENISASLRGKKFSEKRRANISKAMKAVWLTRKDSNGQL